MTNCANILVVLSALSITPLSSAQSFNVIYNFPSISVGYAPSGVPYIGAGGVLFGTTANGGTVVPCNRGSGCGTVFSLTPPSPPGASWTQATLYNFQGQPDGLQPAAGVLPGNDGTLVGTTYMGGSINAHCRYGCGTAFALTPPSQPGTGWTETMAYDFAKADFQPFGLIAGSSGSYFGAATFGGNQGCSSGCGSIYQLVPAEAGGVWTLRPIHQFAFTTGEYPNSPLVEGADGVLYGATAEGGNNNQPCSSGCGTVFSLTPPLAPSTQWAFQEIYRFPGGSDSELPETGLILGVGGILYGTTYSGGGTGCGGNGCGTIFSLMPPGPSGGVWTKTTLYIFQGGSDGSNPNSQSALVSGANGVLYGVTQSGGINCLSGCGTLFQLTPPAVQGGVWTKTTLHFFTGAADGYGPQSGPAVDPNGVIYGYTYGGTGTGCFGGPCGVVYQYTP